MSFMFNPFVLFPTGGISGFIQHFDLSDVTGSTVNDQTTSYDGTINGGATTESGDISDVIRLDGTDDSITSAPTFSTASDNSIVLRFNQDASPSGTQQVFAVQGSGNYDIMGLQILTNGKIRVFGFNGVSYTYIESTLTVSTATTHTLTYQKEGSTHKVFIGNTEYISGALTINTFSATEVKYGGGYNGTSKTDTEMFKGTQGTMIRLFDEAISQLVRESIVAEA